MLSCSVMSDSLWPHELYSMPGSFAHGDSPGKNTGVASLSLLQGIFPTQGSKPGLPHCRRILYQLSHQGSPRIPNWVAYSFSKGSSRPRNQTGVSCIAGRFFFLPAKLPREAHSNSTCTLELLGRWSKISCIKWLTPHLAVVAQLSEL